MGSGALYAAAHRRALFAVVLAALMLVALTLSACLTSGAGTSANAGTSAGASTSASTAPASVAPADHHCPDHGPPVPACHNQADLQLTTHAAGPRPDADLYWDHPRYAAERAGLPGSPFADPAPDLIALSISRT